MVVAGQSYAFLRAQRVHRHGGRVSGTIATSSRTVSSPLYLDMIQTKPLSIRIPAGRRQCAGRGGAVNPRLQGGGGNTAPSARVCHPSSGPRVQKRSFAPARCAAPGPAWRWPDPNRCRTEDKAGDGNPLCPEDGGPCRHRAGSVLSRPTGAAAQLSRLGSVKLDSTSATTSRVRVSAARRNTRSFATGDLRPHRTKVTVLRGLDVVSVTPASRRSGTAQQQGPISQGATEVVRPRAQGRRRDSRINGP